MEMMHQKLRNSSNLWEFLKCQGVHLSSKSLKNNQVFSYLRNLD